MERDTARQFGSFASWNLDAPVKEQVKQRAVQLASCFDRIQKPTLGRFALLHNLSDLVFHNPREIADARTKYDALFEAIRDKR